MRFYSQMNLTRHPLPVVALILTLTFLLALAAMATPAKGKYLFYVGTYTADGSKSKGIYAYSYDAATAQIAPLGLAAETTNPSFVDLHPNGRFLYAVNEVGNYKGPNSGGVSAFSVDRATGKLTLLNEVASRGADPCYITLDRTGKYVLVANYTGGSVAVFPVLEDGKLGEASAFVQHTGHGPNAQRQEAAHAHSIDLSLDNRFAMVDDLGLDELRVYKFDSSKGSLAPNDPPFAKLDPGGGPRHFALHPSGKFGYVLTEMHSSVTVFSNDAKTGTLTPLQTISALPKDFTGRNDDAEIEVHPSGKFLYASNRGHDSITVFAIDPSKGTLTLVEYASTKGKEPRSFEIDPTGTLLFAANQKSDNIVVFRIDQKTGKLTPTGQVLDVASPVCVKFLKLE
ncbi:MAG TPA: lactonase family protein [Candidatus Sulfotelmatobacter sp.]|nr:lactonase family protein [Candidatus Sulfotelmatobacter sp.]